MVLKYNVCYEVASTIFLIELLFFIKMQYNTKSILNKEFCVCLFHLSFSYQKLYPEVKLTI